MIFERIQSDILAEWPSPENFGTGFEKNLCVCIRLLSDYDSQRFTQTDKKRQKQIK